MVYIPYEVVERLMISKWESELHSYPEAPKPTTKEMRIEWYRMLEFYPLNLESFRTFVSRFPLEDRKKIRFRPYTGTSTWVGVRTPSPFC